MLSGSTCRYRDPSTTAFSASRQGRTAASNSSTLVEEFLSNTSAGGCAATAVLEDVLANILHANKMLRSASSGRSGIEVPTIPPQLPAAVKELQLLLQSADRNRSSVAPNPEAADTIKLSAVEEARAAPQRQQAPPNVPTLNMMSLAATADHNPPQEAEMSKLSDGDQLRPTPLTVQLMPMRGVSTDLIEHVKDIIAFSNRVVEATATGVWPSPSSLGSTTPSPQRSSFLTFPEQDLHLIAPPLHAGSSVDEWQVTKIHPSTDLVIVIEQEPSGGRYDVHAVDERAPIIPFHASRIGPALSSLSPEGAPANRMFFLFRSAYSFRDRHCDQVSSETRNSYDGASIFYSGRSVIDLQRMKNRVDARPSSVEFSSLWHCLPREWSQFVQRCSSQQNGERPTPSLLEERANYLTPRREAHDAKLVQERQRQRQRTASLSRTSRQRSLSGGLSSRTSAESRQQRGLQLGAAGSFMMATPLVLPKEQQVEERLHHYSSQRPPVSSRHPPSLSNNAVICRHQPALTSRASSRTASRVSLLNGDQQIPAQTRQSSSSAGVGQQQPRQQRRGISPFVTSAARRKTPAQPTQSNNQ